MFFKRNSLLKHFPEFSRVEEGIQIIHLLNRLIYQSNLGQATGEVFDQTAIT